MNCRIRTASPDDAAEILKIYAPYVEETAITFEYDVPSVSEFRGRIENTLRKYPYLLAESEGEIIGYAYTGAFVGRQAYDWSAETTVYVQKDRKKNGCRRVPVPGAGKRFRSAEYPQSECVYRLPGSGR